MSSSLSEAAINIAALPIPDFSKSLIFVKSPIDPIIPKLELIFSMIFSFISITCTSSPEESKDDAISSLIFPAPPIIMYIRYSYFL